MELLKTGIAGLDEILCGGIVPHNSYLIKGIPGSGKTTLGVEVIIQGIKTDQFGLIVTFEERPEKLYRDFANLGWDLRSYEQENRLKVISSSPMAAKEMLANPDSILSRYIADYKVERLLVDSISSFARLEENPVKLREIVHQFINSLITKEITPFFIMEAQQFRERKVSFEEYLTDAVIFLSYEQRGDRRRERFIEILKTRGHRHIEGRHALKIGNKGLEIYPSCQPSPGGFSVSPLRHERINSGVSGLDVLVSGGFPKGSNMLIAGSSGTGKTSIGIQFLAAGAQRGERGILVLLQENPANLILEAKSIGIDFQRLESENCVQIIYLSPIHICPDELMFRLKSVVKKHLTARLVIDSISDLLHSIADEDYRKDFIFSLTEFLRNQGVTSLMTYDAEQMFGSFTLAHNKVPGLIDNLIFLRYVEMEGEITRALSVLKMRGCQHDKGIHEIVTTARGLAIKKRFEGREGLMTGTAKKSIIEMDEIIDHVSRLDDAKKRFKSKKNKGFDPNFSS
ncbi:ATPase domain-containing protein [candidate division CSSED10-310 bacterium]|uniref:non-specific serine/threonine protein kinase n=1 Tax=candidate division CSSED10-310 bacterium TaxID=2855610 RepID=A0ABV6YU99_UNCC1